jgi:hypothetical protein
MEHVRQHAADPASYEFALDLILDGPERMAYR